MLDVVHRSPSDGYCSGFRRREKRDRNNEAARTSRLRRKAREGHVVKEAEVLQQENQVLKDEVGELKKVGLPPFMSCCLWSHVFSSPYRCSTPFRTRCEAE